MDTINKYILDEEDIAFEYEIQKNSKSSLSWSRYIETWKQQNSNDPKRRPVEHVIWLYNRFAEQFKDDLNVWNEYITWMIQINTVFQNKYTEFVLCLHERCLESIKSKDSERICIQYLKIAIEACNLCFIRKALDISLQRIKNKAKHAGIWESILTFLQDKLIPVCTALGEEEEEFALSHPDDKNEDGTSVLEKLETLVYKVLFGTKNSNNINNNSTDENLVNTWASQMLERYLSVCPIDKINDVLLLLSKTHDYPVIESCFKRFLFSKRNFKDHGVPYSLYLIYLNCLDHLSLFKEYNELKTEVQEKYSKEEVNLVIFDINHSIKRSNLEQLSDRLMKELAKTKTLKEFMTLYNYSLDFEQACINIIVQETKTMEVSHDWENALTHHLSRLDKLLDSRDKSISDLRLRQNPNSIEYWRARINMLEDEKERAKEYGHALSKIDPLKANHPGELGELWCEYAQLYWDQEYYSAARELFNTATKVPYTFLEDLEMIYLQWANNEMRIFGKDKALNILTKCLSVPETFESDIVKFYSKVNGKPLAHSILFNSLKLWTFYLDLLESKPLNESSVKIIIDAYETVIKLKLVTPLLFANYADFMNVATHNPIESYKIYERMLNSFTQSVTVQYEIAMKYISDVIKDRAISGMGKEAIREVFENCISQLKGQDEIDITQVYLLFDSYEEMENQGKPTRYSIRVLLDGARSLDDKFMTSKVKLWQLSLDKTESLLGPEACRPIYEECVEKITPDSKCVEYIIKFASLEEDMKEWKRVRELLQYGANLIAPAHNGKLWTFWERFELQHDDKDQYKQMLTLKKQLEDTMTVDTEEVSQQEGHIQFVSSAIEPRHNTNNTGGGTTNPNEIDLDI